LSSIVRFTKDLMKLFVANPTNQDHRFHYYLPEMPGRRELTIPQGSQRQIAGDDFPPAAIDAIEAFYRNYGMIKDDEVPERGKMVSLVFAVGRPVRVERFQTYMTHNEGILIERGKTTRAEAAIQMSAQIEQTMFERQLPDRLQRMQVSIQEDSESPTIAHGVEVSRNAVPEPQRPARRRRRT
jgi:hypothetical protein